jgi:hypothetical protein
LGSIEGGIVDYPIGVRRMNTIRYPFQFEDEVEDERDEEGDGKEDEMEEVGEEDGREKEGIGKPRGRRQNEEGGYAR